ncbi:MAG: aromatic ring-hydroxylating dioxygenase subunit alpha [Gammaproteobacteria bacterium]|nr:aromatic ring-hydroxylating dioxygenase subunit alpha [Gammaproteobacteria bacterium]
MIERPRILLDEHLQTTRLERAWTAPACWYTDPGMHAWELDTVFRPAWQLLGHVGSLVNPGDFLVSDIAGAPVLAVCDRDQRINSFYNVCRHRAGPVAAGRGQCSLFRCRYHGWVYGLDGTLRHTPELGEMAGFNRGSHGLHGIESHITDSLLFVRQSNTNRANGTDIDRVMREIDARISPQQLGNQTFHTSVSYTIDCNWKVYVDNYLEGYHIPQVHPELADILDYRDYKTEILDGYSLQYSNIESATSAYSAGAAYYYFIFPNTMLNILPGRLQTNVVIPLAHNRCRVDFDYYYTDTESDSARVQIDEDLRFGDLVQQQDGTICEQVQRGLASGSYEQGRLSVAREACVHHFQECLRKVFRDPIG